MWRTRGMGHSPVRVWERAGVCVPSVRVRGVHAYAMLVTASLHHRGFHYLHSHASFSFRVSSSFSWISWAAVCYRETLIHHPRQHALLFSSLHAFSWLLRHRLLHHFRPHHRCSPPRSSSSTSSACAPLASASQACLSSAPPVSSSSSSSLLGCNASGPTSSSSAFSHSNPASVSTTHSAPTRPLPVNDDTSMNTLPARKEPLSARTRANSQASQPPAAPASTLSSSAAPSSSHPQSARTRSEQTSARVSARVNGRGGGRGGVRKPTRARVPNEDAPCDYVRRLDQLHSLTQPQDARGFVLRFQIRMLGMHMFSCVLFCKPVVHVRLCFETVNACDALQHVFA